MSATQLESRQNYAEATFRKLEHRERVIDETKFAECQFIGCDFSESRFQRCRFIDCKFTDCTLRLAAFDDSALINATFSRCGLMGINWSAADWSDWSAKLSTLTFDECDLKYAVFLSVDLKRVVLRDCIAHEANFADANLSNATLTGTDLACAVFVRTDLTDADFTGAKNYTLNLADNQTKGAKFDLPEAVRLLYSLDIEIVDPHTQATLEEDDLDRFIRGNKT